MGNTMNVSYMTRGYNNFLKNCEEKSRQKQAADFRDKVAEKKHSKSKRIRNGECWHCFNKRYDNGRI